MSVGKEEEYPKGYYEVIFTMEKENRIKINYLVCLTATLDKEVYTPALEAGHLWSTVEEALEARAILVKLMPLVKKAVERRRNRDV